MMNNRKIESIDFFADNVYNVNKLEDIKHVETINVLEKNDEYISFELGGDFFKYYSNEDNIIQYPDFVSIRDGKQNYDMLELFENTDGNHERLFYLTAIREAIKSHEVINNLKDYTLKDRDNYIKENLKNVLPINTSFNLDRNNIESRINKTKQVTNELLKPVDTPELRDLKNISELALTTVAMFSLFYKNLKIRNSKNSIINHIITNYSDKNLKSILHNKEIRTKFPEIDNVLNKFDKFNTQLNIDKGIRENAEKIVSEILKNEDAMLLANKLSDVDDFQDYLKKNNRNFMELRENIISEINIDLIDKLLSNKDVHLKELINEANKPFEESKFIEVFSELNLSPTEDAKNFCVANEIINDLLKENSSMDKSDSINRVLNSMNLESVDKRKITDIIECISRKILGLEINHKKTSKEYNYNKTYKQ